MTSVRLKWSSTLTATRVFSCYVPHFYLTGKLHLVDGLCVLSFCQEMDYWGIGEGQLDWCCSNKFQELMALAEDRRSQESCSAKELSAATFQGSCCSDVRRSVWLHLEEPGHSASAKVMAVVSVGVVIGSIISTAWTSTRQRAKAL